MRFLSVVLMSVALTAGCKKDVEPEPAPEVAKAPVEISWGPASFDGSRAVGNKGTLTVAVTYQNNSGGALLLDVIGVQTFAPDGTKVCSTKSTYGDKANDGDAINISFNMECEYQRLPPSGDLTLKGTTIYRVAGQRVELPVDTMVQFNR